MQRFAEKQWQARGCVLSLIATVAVQPVLCGTWVHNSASVDDDDDDENNIIEGTADFQLHAIRQPIEHILLAAAHAGIGAMATEKTATA